jgi:hypothetical protein
MAALTLNDNAADYVRHRCAQASSAAAMPDWVTSWKQQERNRLMGEAVRDAHRRSPVKGNAKASAKTAAKLLTKPPSSPVRIA